MLHSLFNNWRLLSLTMAFGLAVVTTAGVFYTIGQNSTAPASAQLAYSDIRAEPFYEYIDADAKFYRSVDGRTYISESGDVIKKDAFKQGQGSYTYYAEDGEQYASLDGLVYFDSTETETFVIAEDGALVTTSLAIAENPESDRSTTTALIPGSGIQLEQEAYRGQGDILFRDPQSFLQTPALNDFDFGDIDGDGDLDLAIGRNRQPNQIFLNVGGVYSLTWTATETFVTKSVEWGDVDGDGDLDLAVGNRNDENLLYLNNNGRLQHTAIWTDNITSDLTNDLKWADMNGDGWLDLIVANGANTPNRIFLNDGTGALMETAVWSDIDTQALETLLIDLGRFDNDDALDMALAIQKGADEGEGVFVFKNELATNNTMTLMWQGGKAPVVSVAWGDVDEEQDTLTELAIADTSVDGLDGVYSIGADDAEANVWRPEFDGLALDAAWGDVNGDGQLDLAIALSANGHERVYLNEGDSLAFTPEWTSDGFGHARKLEWADIDNDRDLDLVVHYGQQLSVYLNQQPPFTQFADQLDEPHTAVNSFATDLADFNGDGLLDIAIGNSGFRSNGATNLLYLNQNGNLFGAEPLAIGTEFQQTFGVAWGDANADGLPDLAVANGGSSNSANLVYIAERQGAEVVFKDPPLILPHNENSRDIVWGDVDGDGDLDLIVANRGKPNRIYFNDGTGNFDDGATQFGCLTTCEQENATGFSSTRLDLADIDADGDLDLAVANSRQPNRIYFNVNGRFSDEFVQSLGSNEISQGIAWGDFDGDGRIDLAVANKNSANQLYWNAGGYLYPTPIWESEDIDDTHNLAWGDADGDGDLDLAVANRGGNEEYAPIPNKIYLNEAGILQTAREETLWNSDSKLPSLDVDWGDVDNDGDLDLVFANGLRILDSKPDSSYVIANEVYLNDLVPINANKPDAPPASIAIQKMETNDVRLPILNTQAIVVDNGRLDITYELSHPEGLPYRTVRGFYSLDGGNTFSPAQPSPETVTTNLSSLPNQNVHTYEWNIFQSGLFGSSSNVVFRLEALEVTAANSEVLSGTFTYQNQQGLDAQRAFVAVNTFPLRVRGNQVQVLFECDSEVADIRPCPTNINSDEPQPIENATVFGLPANQAVGANLLSSLTGQVFGTDGQGYLEGRTILSQDDQLVSLWPVPTETINIPFTNRARLFYMSATPTNDGLESTVVETLDGIQQITISNHNPLILFDLIVSIEWDASQDVAFMTELETAFKRASDILFDVSNGQVAIGNVYVFHAKQYWNIADIVLLANNDLRPSAAIGGVVNEPVSETLEDGTIINDAYLPGQIRMGPSWDPFGQSTAELTEDWYRALAHELAHYVFFLPDNYLGFEDGVLRRINCQGSFMTTTRDPAYSEFLAEPDWLEGNCESSIAENTTKRNDWQTITTFYPFLNAPSDELAEEMEVVRLDGPGLLPLGVTELVSFGLDYGTERQILPTRIFEIRDAQNERLRVPNATVYLIQTQGTLTETDDVLIHMGTTNAGGDRVQVRGAFAGDKLCLVDETRNPPLHNCEELDASDVSIRLFEQTRDDWHPIIEATAVSNTDPNFAQDVQLTIEQDLAENEEMYVQVFPAHYNSYPENWDSAPTAVISTAGSRHTVNVPLLRPEFDVAVRVWINDNSHRETLTQFILTPIWDADEYEIPNVITIPLTADYNYVLIGNPNNIPIGGPNNIPIGGPNNIPIGGPNNIPIGGPNNIPIGGPNNIPIGGPNNIPIGGPNNIPIGGPNNIPIGGPNNIPIGGPNNIPIGGPNNIPIGGPNNIPIGGPNNIPIGGPNNIPIGGPNNIPIGGPNNIPIGGARDLAAYAPILSADAQVVIYNKKTFSEDSLGFFEDSGVNSLQLLSSAPELPSWYVQVGQAYRVDFEQDMLDGRIISFSYLQKDVPEGFENTLLLAFFPDDGEAWELLETRQFVENLIVADVVTDSVGMAINGTYAVVSTIALPEVQNGWNLFAYPLPITRTVSLGVGSIVSYTQIVVEATGTTAVPPNVSAASEAQLLPKVNVNVRSGPGLSEPIISYLLKDEQARVLHFAPAENWQTIECPARALNEAICWVTGRERYVEITAEDSTAENSGFLEFGHVYWVYIEGLADGETIRPYLAPPTLGADGSLE